jgi:hypothetical protein
MEYTEHKLTLDVHKTVSNASVALKKGDTAHRLLITLSEGGYPYHIGEDCTAVFSALKPDGTAIFNDCRIEGDTVIYDMTEQTTAEEGMVSCEIQIYGANGALLTSASFLLFVEEGVNNKGAVVSSGEFSTLISMVREVNRATGEANRATERANKAAAACKVIGSAQGEAIHLDDAIDAPLVGMRIFGKTTQSGVPTPANPATLVNMGSVGSIKLTSAGKNLLPYPYYPAEPTLNGLTYTDNKDGSITVTGTSTGYSGFWFTGYNFRLRKGVEYTLSAFGDYTIEGSAVLTATSSKHGVITSIYLTSQRSASFVPDDDYADVAIYMYVPNEGNAVKGTVKPQLELGSVATQYEPYKGNSVTISVSGGLPGIPVASGGNYIDSNGKQWICDEVDLARGVYIKRTHTRVINEGSSLLLSQREGFNRFEARFADDYIALHETQALCSHFRVSSRLLNTNDTNNIICAYAGTARVFLRFDQCATVEELAAWLAENPVTFVYSLANPIETGLPDEVIDAFIDYIQSHSGDTVVTNDSDAHMALEYIMDAKKYIDKMISTGIHDATLE